MKLFADQSYLEVRQIQDGNSNKLSSCQLVWKVDVLLYIKYNLEFVIGACMILLSFCAQLWDCKLGDKGSVNLLGNTRRHSYRRQDVEACLCCFPPRQQAQDLLAEIPIPEDDPARC